MISLPLKLLLLLPLPLTHMAYAYANPPVSGPGSAAAEYRDHPSLTAPGVLLLLATDQRSLRHQSFR
jgi:hypothetical protein